jgi:2-polyprenyl-3-methyl-5-hydroxy-6-metoxy-1,4-benzoquinol methylase
MEEKFDKDYFFGNKKSNYIAYDRLDPHRQFGSIISFIKKQKIGGNFLDVGCALGILLKAVTPFFDRVYGMDISQFAIKYARQNVPEAHLMVLNLERGLPYPKESFDCITALDVLEHTKNFKRNFSELTKKLKHNGYLIISVPIDTIFWKFVTLFDKDTTHVSILKEKELMQIIKKNKLKIVRKRYFCPHPKLYRVWHIPAEVELMLKKE